MRSLAVALSVLVLSTLAPALEYADGAGIDAVDARMRRLNVKLRPRGGVADGGVTA